MTSSRRFAGAAAFVLVGTIAVGAAQDRPATVTGRVTDGSGAALPGVVVTLTASAPPAAPAPVSIVTDGVGQYLSPPVAAGIYTIAFALPGFEAQTRAGVGLRAGDVLIVDQQLEVASLKESVEVVAAAPPPPAPPPPPPPPVRLMAPARPQPVPVPKDVLASVCGPGQATGNALTIGHLIAHRDERNRTLYGNGDVLIIDAGSDVGLVAGQNLVVRRTFRAGATRGGPRHAVAGEQTAGLIQVVDTGERVSVAVVVYTCGELFAGDTVEPFDALPLLTAQGLLVPHYDDPAHIVLGDHGQTLGAERQLMVIDRGTVQGAARGQRLTIFRRALGDRGPVQAIADAIIVAVRADSATIRIERASDAVSVGDLVALHR
jgi:hypothetical protein